MMTHKTLTGLALLGLAATVAGCGRADAPSSLSAPSAPQANVPTPSVTAISPNVGSTSGGTPIMITGNALQPGVTVNFDSVTVPGTFDSRYTDRIFVQTPAHVAGTLDVVVTNAGGQPGRFVGGYTYVSPESFDFNGRWAGFAWDGSDRSVSFTIQDDGVVRVSCETSTITFSSPPLVSNGAFSFAQGDGNHMSGKIVSASVAVGTIDIAPCANTVWRTSRQ